MPVAVSACAITVPDPAVAPLTPDCETVHAKVVPVTLLVSVTVVVPPEQILCEEGVAVSVGTGLTVTVAVIAVPGQPPTEGVIV